MGLIQDEPLLPILKSDGKESELYPADLISLLCYDSKNPYYFVSSMLSDGTITGETMKRLLADYDLPVDDVLQVNFNRFMAHIGLFVLLDGNSDTNSKTRYKTSTIIASCPRDAASSLPATSYRSSKMKSW